MCKYCEFTYVDEDTGEKSNDVKTIKRIKEGHCYYTDLNINRYQDGDGYYRNELIIDNMVKLGDGLHTVHEEHIDIKYCPFCGEEL